MARMSIDDSVARDPRITLLAKMLGWSRHAALGCLVADVWPICYDQATHLISPKLIDAASGQAGFADAMVDCELAKRVRGGKLSVSGAAERIEYLEKKKESGRVGGIKSAELRRKISSITTSTPSYGAQAPWNPPDPVLVPDPVPASVPVPDPVPGKKDVPAPPDACLALADLLLAEVLRKQPGNRTAKNPLTRSAWARTLDLAIRIDKRTDERIRTVVAWIFHGQTGQFQFQVMSADALRDKFDAIELRMARPSDHPPATTNASMLAHQLERIAKTEEREARERQGELLDGF